MSENTQITIQPVSDDIKLAGFKTSTEALGFANLLITSKLVPPAFKTPEAVVAVILQGRELGFGPVTSLNNINNIQGKPTLNVHAIAAKLATAGVAYQLIQDYAPVYKPGTEELIDRVTTFRFYKKWHGETITNEVSYHWSEAAKAGLTTKDNWTKMPRIMLRARCLAVGARLAAPEALLGLYETSEWADVTNTPYEVTDEGEVTIIQ